MAEPAAGDAMAWRTIDELAAAVGAYCWLEQRLFEMTGAWATGSGPEPSEAGGEPEARVWCAAVSRRHGALAGRWAERLPVRAGVDAAALVTAPEGPPALGEALEELAATKEVAVRLAALVGTVLPWVGGVYGAHLAHAAPASEAPVVEVLVAARREGSAEIQGGLFLLRRLPEAGQPSGHLGKTIERTFKGDRASPAARPS